MGSIQEEGHMVFYKHYSCDIDNLHSVVVVVAQPG